MALFGGKETKVDKKEAKTQAILEKYGLEQLTGKNAEAVRAIAQNMTAGNWIELGTALSGKSEDVAKLGYLRSIMEQNFIIIRQLDELINLMKK